MLLLSSLDDIDALFKYTMYILKVELPVAEIVLVLIE
jgi:hypothetical protein